MKTKRRNQPQRKGSLLLEMDRVSQYYRRRALTAPVSAEGEPPMLVFRQPVPFRVLLPFQALPSKESVQVQIEPQQ